MNFESVIKEIMSAENEDMRAYVNSNDITELKLSDFIDKAAILIAYAENNDKEGYDAFEERLKKKYGQVDTLYIIAFVDKLLDFVDNFRRRSKRAVCMEFILSEAVFK